jgi:16S rRNA (uracil1498-N3)-methyltransferase
LQFVYSEDAGKESLKVEGEIYKYLFKVRRHKAAESIAFRNLLDGMLYMYKIVHIEKKSAMLELESATLKEIKPKKKLHLGWCIIEPKIIEKTLPMLNELGVYKITLIYCERSQKNFKIDLDRLKRILISSSGQCGRSTLMKIEIKKSLEEFLAENKDITVLDFCENKIGSTFISSILIGCEGGFTKDERILLKKFEKVGLDVPTILRSETATVSVASKILL